MATPSAPEVLERGRRGPRPPTRRTRLLAAVVVALAAIGFVADRDARGQERQDVAGCVSMATDAVALAAGRVTIMVRFVGPSLAGSATGALRDSLLGMISAAAAPAAGPLRRAVDRCSATDVLWFHTHLRATRDDCLLMLHREAAYLRAVVRDGTRVYELNRTVSGRCRPARP